MSMNLETGNKIKSLRPIESARGVLFPAGTVFVIEGTPEPVAMQFNHGSYLLANVESEENKVVIGHRSMQGLFETGH